MTSVVESGGDGGTNVPAKFTGQTYPNTAGFGITTVGHFGEDARPTQIAAIKGTA